MQQFVWMRKLLAFLMAAFGIIAVSGANAQPKTLDNVQALFSQKNVVRANFTQVRSISGMTQPLSSNGQLLVSKELGVWWHQQRPFVMTLTLTNDRITQTLKGQKPQIIDAQNNPQMFEFSSLLQALFRTDKEVLEQNFQMTFHSDESGLWTLELIPQTSPLDKIFGMVTLFGDADLKTIELLDKRGDMTQINFFYALWTDDNQTLSTQERACFEP